MAIQKTESLAQSLATLPMFSGLADQQCEALARCATYVSCAADDQLFCEGDVADGFLILKRGRVKMRKISPTGHEVILHISAPPNMIGCRALTSKGSTYPADAVCLDPVEAFRFTRSRFMQAVSDSPDVFFGLLVDMNRRLSEIYTLQSALMEPVEQRIANLILHKALPADRDLSEWSKHPLKEVRLTKSVIGSIVGTSTETAIRILSKWKKQGLIASERGKTRIIDPQAVFDIARTTKS